MDGIITSTFNMSKPMSDIVAVSLQAWKWCTDYNPNQCTISIQDCEKKKMIWNYSHTFNGSIGSTRSQLIANIMRHSNKRMPYMLDAK